jgi:Carboxypeptidase regulatory-like domain
MARLSAQCKYSFSCLFLLWDKLLWRREYSGKGETLVSRTIRPRVCFFSFLFVVALMVGALQPRYAFAQTTSGSIFGRVTDQSNAVIPDVEVEIKNTDTGVTQVTKTNGEGVYTFPLLDPGHYLMNVRKQQFQTVSVTGITLNLQDNLSRNFVLQVGSSAVSITVDGSGLVLNTTDASVSTVVDHTYVENMPLNGRSFQDLILLTPGIVTVSPQPTGLSGLGVSGEFSVNGQRTESNYYTVDGVSANAGAAPGGNMLAGAGPTGSLATATALGTTQALVSVDDLQEFRVQSSTYSAEYGRNPGGQFAFETKLGTNNWHGTAYEYLRNGALDAPDWFNDYLGVDEPALRQNDFGGTLGAPVRIPHLYNGKDRTFFFVSYEGLRLVAPQPAAVSFVPDAALRASAPTPLQQVLNAFPVQSPTGIDDAANGIAQFIGSWSNPASIDSTSVRIDHVVNDKLRLFFRFSDTESNSTARSIGNISPTANSMTAYTLRSYTAGGNSAFSSRLSNQFRLNYTSNVTTENTVIDAFGGSTPLNLIQLAGLGPNSSPGVALFIGPYLTDLTVGASSGAQRQWNFVDTVGLSLGRHQFRFGADYRRLAPLAIQPPVNASYLYFSPTAVETNSASIFASAIAPAYPLYTNFSAFVQDEWRVSQRLSLSFGLRWEVNPAPSVTQGLKPYTIQEASPDTLVLAPLGTPLWRTTWFNFAPRLGAAYIFHSEPGRETIVRGGGGVFYDTGQQLGSQSFNGPGFASESFLSGTFPGSVLPPPIVNPPVAPFDDYLPYGFASHLQLPYTLQWNASIEQAFGSSDALTVSYVGSHAARLLRQNEFQPPNNPDAFEYFVIENGLTSDYNALQVQFRRKLSRGLTALASYTWSHCIDYGSSDFLVGYQRGNCDFDVRNNFSAAFSYDLPNAGRNAVANAILHHWGLDDRFTARTAFPVTLNGLQFIDPATGNTSNAGLDLVPGVPLYLYGANCTSVLDGLGDLAPGKACPGGWAINPDAFALPPTDPNTGDPIREGDAPRNFVRGLGAWQMDIAMRREFPIREGLKLQFRAEAFNVFNHPNFGTINSSFGQETFGQATATLASSLGILSPLYQQGGPRSIQFALRLMF